MGQRDNEAHDAIERTERLPAGKVEFDSRGNSVWRWNREGIDSTSLLLKGIENADLALEPTQKVPVAGGNAKKPSAPAQAGKHAALKSTKQRQATGHAAPLELSVTGTKPDGGGGFDPYNSGR